MNPEVNQAKCDGCWTCVDMCPMEYFKKGKDGKVVVVKKSENDCIGCNVCEINCESGAIKVKGD